MKLILVLAALPAAASFALGGKIDGPGKPKAAADVERTPYMSHLYAVPSAGHKKKALLSWVAPWWW